MSTLLKDRHLNKFFKTPRGMLHAVENVSFDIEKGSTLGVVGESGCGKSTLGRTVVRLLSPSSGEIFYKERNIVTAKSLELKELRQEMQMIFQDPFSSLNPRMSIFTLIAEPILIHKKAKNHRELEERVFELMNLVGLEKRLENSFPHELDGGRRQRIGVARALALNPDFIVCDEPVSALDVSIQAQILNLLEDLQEHLGLTYMFITHDMSVVRHISDVLMVMYRGNVVEFGSSEEVFNRRLHPYTNALMSAVPNANIHIKRETALLKGEISSPINPPDACRFANRCPYARELCQHKAPELRDINQFHQVACHFAESIYSDSLVESNSKI